MKWIRRWEVPGSDEKPWIISQSEEGEFGCSCPIWKFKREECKHIIMIKGGGGELKVPETPEEIQERLFAGLKTRGYRYLTWVSVDYSSKEYARIRSNPDYESVKSIIRGNVRYIMVKEKPETYGKYFQEFVNKLQRINYRRKRVKIITCRNEYRNEFRWVRQREIREDLQYEWHKLRQLILFNESGDINPNLPEGSVYMRGEWGQKIKRLEKAYKFIR